MRVLSLVATVCLLLALTASAWAFTWPNGYRGPVKFKLVNYDVGTLYDVNDGTYGRTDGNTVDDATAIGALDALTQIKHPSLAPNEDSWGVFYLTDILGQADQVGNPGVYDLSLFNWTTSPFELTGIFFGEQDTYLDQSSNGIISQDIRGVGVEMAVFQDYARNFDPMSPTGSNLGPNARGLLENGAAGPGSYYYPTATDGSLIWTMNSIPGYITQPVVYQDEFFSTFEPESIPPDNLTVSGGFHADMGSISGWGEGPDNRLLKDVRFNFTGEIGPGEWTVLSDDPVTATAVPEGSTRLLMIVGMALMGLFVWRRRTA